MNTPFQKCTLQTNLPEFGKNFKEACQSKFRFSLIISYNTQKWKFRFLAKGGIEEGRNGILISQNLVSNIFWISCYPQITISGWGLYEFKIQKLLQIRTFDKLTLKKGKWGVFKFLRSGRTTSPSIELVEPTPMPEWHTQMLLHRWEIDFWSSRRAVPIETVWEDVREKSYLTHSLMHEDPWGGEPGTISPSQLPILFL